MGTRRCCCGSCTLGADDFNRADSDDPGPLWSEESGDWDIDGNRLKGTSAGLLATTICHPSWATLGSFIASFDLDDPTNGKVYSIRAGNPNTSLREATWTFTGSPGAGTIEISATNGTDTNSFTVNWQDEPGPYRVTVCYVPGVLLSARKPINMVESGSATYTTVCIDETGTAACFSGLGNFSFLEGDFDNWDYEIHWIENHNCSQCLCQCREVVDGIETFTCAPDVLYATISNVANCSGIDQTQAMHLRTASGYNNTSAPDSYVDYARNFWVSDTFECPTGESEMAFCIILECQIDVAYDYPRWIAHIVRWMPGGRNCSGIGFIDGDPDTIVAQCSEVGIGTVCYESTAYAKSSSTCTPFYLQFGNIEEYSWSCSEDPSGCCNGQVVSGVGSDPPAYMTLEITE